MMNHIYSKQKTRVKESKFTQYNKLRQYDKQH